MKETISKSIPRVDARAKLRGEAQYIADMPFDNLLYAKTLRSTNAKAKIKSIKLPEIPDGYFIIDKNDVPGKNRMRTVVSDHPIFAEDEVQYIGQPILLVVGENREIIYDILSNIQVEYEAEIPLLTLEDAEKTSAVFTDYHYDKGEPDEAFKKAKRIIEDEFSTGYQEHAYLEPNGMAAEYKNGTLFIYGSMQCPFYAQNALIETMDLPEDKIRVVQVTTGGAFGGKEEFPSLTACQMAVATRKTQKPVMMIYDRDEDIICSTKRHPSKVRIKAGLDEDDNIIAMKFDVRFNAGAYNGLSPVVLQRGIFSATGVYNIPHLEVHGRNFMTNSVPSGAYRGFGAPQTIFATEMMLHNIAKILGVDPLDYKKRHLLKRNDPTATGGQIHDEVKLTEIIDKVTEISNYSSKIKNNQKYKGIGISLFLHGCGFTGRGEADIKGVVILKKSGQTVTLQVSSVEMGQGAETILRKIVAYTLEIPMEQVDYQRPDTGEVPDSGPTVASRTTMIVGGLLRQAALEMKDRWRESDSFQVSKKYTHPDFLNWDDDKFQGDAYPVYSWGANVAEVTIDPVTYELTINNLYGVYDVGVPIDERSLKGQMQGGIAQGIGWATIEVMESAHGTLKQANLTDYKVPTTMDVPKMNIEFVTNPYEFGPFGAKCAGELPFVGAPPAVAAAVANALGKPVNHLPITPEKLMELDNGN